MRTKQKYEDIALTLNKWVEYSRQVSEEFGQLAQKAKHRGDSEIAGSLGVLLIGMEVVSDSVELLLEKLSG